MINSDNLNIVLALNGIDEQLHWENLSWLDLVLCSLQKFSRSKCVYLPRSFVSFADALASFGSTLLLDVHKHFPFDVSSPGCNLFLDSVSPNWSPCLEQTVRNICNSFLFA